MLGLDRGRGDSCYVWHVAKSAGVTYVVDAERRGNFCRFLNHGDAANVVLKVADSPDGIRLLLFAESAIAPGDELLCDYGDGMWRMTGASPVKAADVRSFSLHVQAYFRLLDSELGVSAFEPASFEPDLDPQAFDFLYD